MTGSTSVGTGLSSIRRVVMAAFIGSTMEWYDFYLYGTATVLVLNKLFFPAGNATTATLAALATYTVGFLARPVGAMVAGHLGDRIGRRPVLVLSLIGMGLASSLVGVLPTYARIGMAAPALLVVLRLLQGFAVGGEQGGSAVLTVESANAKRRGLWGSLGQSGSAAGLLLASSAFLLMRAVLPKSEFLAWGWRVPFLFSFVLIAVGLVIRLTVREPAVFAAVARTRKSRRPVRDVLRHHRRSLLLATGMRVSQTAASYFYTVFALFYINLRVPEHATVGTLAIVISSGLSVLSAPFWGALSDVIGRRRVFLAGAIGSAAYIFPFFWIVNTHSPLWIVVGVLIGLNICHDAMFGPQAAWFSELFHTKVRLSGVAIGYQAGSVFGGGLLPLVATSLLLLAGGHTWAICVYFLALSALTVVAAVIAPETRAMALRGSTEGLRVVDSIPPYEGPSETRMAA